MASKEGNASSNNNEVVENPKQPEANSNDCDVKVLPLEQGRLQQHFQEAVAVTVDKYTSAIRLSLFKTHLRDAYVKRPDLLKTTQEQLQTQLKEQITLDANELCESESAAKAMNSLDDLVEKNKNAVGQKAWRPSGNPEKDLQAHLYSQKLKYKAALESLLQKRRSENAALLAKINEKDSRIMELHKKQQEAKKFLQCQNDGLKEKIVSEMDCGSSSGEPR